VNCTRMSRKERRRVVRLRLVISSDYDRMMNMIRIQTIPNDSYDAGGGQG
jgi:hypothetical protein